MRSHIKILAVLHMLYGLTLLSVNFIISVVTTLAASYPDHIIMGNSRAYIFGPDFVLRSLPLWVFSALAVFVGVPQVIGGIGLLLRKDWARILIGFIGLLCLIDFPFGTGLGVYTFWVLLRTQAPEVPVNQEGKL
ncbi:MAG: hypothetical protein JSU74_03830 [Candidatus Zixiibacteriota bacterium]|nr:MAG: hypothetical protein JSU74_03830 [candidate division Zixibacteria bacterium]